MRGEQGRGTKGLSINKRSRLWTGPKREPSIQPRRENRSRIPRGRIGFERICLKKIQQVPLDHRKLQDSVRRCTRRKLERFLPIEGFAIEHPDNLLLLGRKLGLISFNVDRIGVFNPASPAWKVQLFVIGDKTSSPDPVPNMYFFYRTPPRAANSFTISKGP
jgi:hypothetical protein